MRLAYHALNPTPEENCSLKECGAFHRPMAGLMLSLLLSSRQEKRQWEQVLESVVPYLDQNAKKEVFQMIELNRSARTLYTMQHADDQQSSPPMTPLERQLGILRAMKNYCDPQMAKQVHAMEENLSRMNAFSRQAAAFENAAGSSGNNMGNLGALLPLLGTMNGKNGEGNSMAQMAQMMQMMQMMQNMNQAGASPSIDTLMGLLNQK